MSTQTHQECQSIWWLWKWNRFSGTFSSNESYSSSHTGSQWKPRTCKVHSKYATTDLGARVILLMECASRGADHQRLNRGRRMRRRGFICNYNAGMYARRCHGPSSSWSCIWIRTLQICTVPVWYCSNSAVSRYTEGRGDLRRGGVDSAEKWRDGARKR